MFRRMFFNQQKPLSWAAAPSRGINANNWQPKAGEELATLGAGCYWGTEKFFAQDFETKHPGAVLATAVGFMSPDPKASPDPSYYEVCQGDTGYVEVLHLLYDSKVVSYEEVVKHFFTFHDPTTQDKQGHDTGSQYASAIFYHSEEQKKVATNVKEQLQTHFSSGKIPMFRGGKVVTDIWKANKFYQADMDHQRYLELNPRGYCNHLVRMDWSKL